MLIENQLQRFPGIYLEFLEIILKKHTNSALYLERRKFEEGLLNKLKLVEILGNKSVG